MRILTDVALLGHFVNNFDIMWAIMQLKNITYGLDVALCIALIFCTKYWSLVLCLFLIIFCLFSQITIVMQLSFWWVCFYNLVQMDVEWFNQLSFHFNHGIVHNNHTSFPFNHVQFPDSLGLPGPWICSLLIIIGIYHVNIHINYTIIPFNHNNVTEVATSKFSKICNPKIHKRHAVQTYMV